MDEDTTFTVTFFGFFSLLIVIAVMFNYLTTVGLGSAYSKAGSSLPCDKVVTISQKYQKMGTVNGMIMLKNMVVISGEEYPVINQFSLDFGKSEWDNIEVGSTGLVFGAKDVIDGPYIQHFQPVTVKKSDDNSCINCCVVV